MTGNGANGLRAGRFWAALSFPVVAFFLQWLLWWMIQPFVWFLFYPAVFFSSRVGGIAGGLASTVLSTSLVLWFFMALAVAALRRLKKECHSRYA